MVKFRPLIKIQRRHAPGAPPGQIEPERSARKPRVRVIAYGPQSWTDEADASLETIRALRDKYPVVWIDVEEFGDAQLIRQIGEMFGLHQLALEDSINTHQRPKAEEYGDHLFIVARMLQERGVETEQVAFFLGEGYLVTFQELPGDCFDPVRERLGRSTGRFRSNGADYLCYALLDSIIDAYFPVIESYGEALEDLEEKVVSHAQPHHVTELHDMKRDLLMLRRAIWPHREMINSLLRDEHDTIRPDTRPFLRDCYDHTVQLMDIVEIYREISSGLMDIYMSSVSVRANEVMKTLTIVATIFIPLSFIASLYGMNFERSASPWNMPELGWYFGYPYALTLMLGAAGLLLAYLWRRGWLFDGRPLPSKRKRPEDAA
ncbi:MAG: magnesium/cobalt transporter CorA [Alphaproteobacteria bacterium]|nr:magnesium/cobalt transporter CorA [Alphaproteobacteria bacterium]